VLILCATVILLEGFDIQAAGVSATKVALAFNLESFGKGLFLGASAVGIFIASVLGGFPAYKYGRKPIVVSSVIIFGIFSLSTLLAKGVGAMVILAQAILYAFAPLCYSPSIRNAGVGAAIAAGRLGTIAGPLLAGSLLGAGKTAADILFVLIPITLASGTMALFMIRISSKRKESIEQ
jgi:MFS family permease